MKRELPVALKAPRRSRKGIYVLEDNFLNFWFEFVFPNSDDKGIRMFVLDDLKNYLGP